jgi:hypothetical protein
MNDVEHDGDHGAGVARCVLDRLIRKCAGISSRPGHRRHICLCAQSEASTTGLQHCTSPLVSRAAREGQQGLDSARLPCRPRRPIRLAARPPLHMSSHRDLLWRRHPTCLRAQPEAGTTLPRRCTSISPSSCTAGATEPSAPPGSLPTRTSPPRSPTARNPGASSSGRCSEHPTSSQMPRAEPLLRGRHVPAGTPIMLSSKLRSRSYERDRTRAGRVARRRRGVPENAWPACDRPG